MFTGIVETVGAITAITDEGSNRTFNIRAKIDGAIKVDQSIAHNGTCLTVTAIAKNEEASEKEYTVTAISETLEKTNLGELKTGDSINIERCMKADARVDGHFVQGHVDGKGKVIDVRELDGSWEYRIGFDQQFRDLIVSKGSICVNGVSLTVVEVDEASFAIAIIPFTYEHTNFNTLSEGDSVNLEFDILGKYIVAALERRA